MIQFWKKQKSNITKYLKGKLDKESLDYFEAFVCNPEDKVSLFQAVLEQEDLVFAKSMLRKYTKLERSEWPTNVDARLDFKVNVIDKLISAKNWKLLEFVETLLTHEEMELLSVVSAILSNPEPSQVESHPTVMKFLDKGHKLTNRYTTYWDHIPAELAIKLLAKQEIKDRYFDLMVVGVPCKGSIYSQKWHLTDALMDNYQGTIPETTWPLKEQRGVFKYEGKTIILTHSSWIEMVNSKELFDHEEVKKMSKGNRLVMRYFYENLWLKLPTKTELYVPNWRMFQILRFFNRYQQITIDPQVMLNMVKELPNLVDIIQALEEQEWASFHIFKELDSRGQMKFMKELNKFSDKPAGVSDDGTPLKKEWSIIDDSKNMMQRLQDFSPAGRMGIEELHNHLIGLTHLKREKRLRVNRFFYPAELQRFHNHTFKDFKIVIPEDPTELWEAGKELHNCVGGGGYSEKIKSHETFIVLLSKKGQYMYCLEIQQGGILAKNWKVIQAKKANNVEMDQRFVSSLMKYLNSEPPPAKKA